MRVLIDTNVVLDVLLAREPFFDKSAAVLDALERKRAVGLVGATTVTTLHYLVCRAHGDLAARTAIRGVLTLCRAAAVDHEVLWAALDAGGPDCEDAVLLEAAVAAGADAIVTRNVDDLATGRIPVLTPEEFLGRLAAAGD